MKEPKFIPKPGQTDYTNIRYAPAIDIVVAHEGRILLAKRSADRLLYPNNWGTIDGFLDDHKSIEEKAYEELQEELGLAPSDVLDLQRGDPLIYEDMELGKTWLIVPVLARVRSVKTTLDWEASEVRWCNPKDIVGLDLVPGTRRVIGRFFPEVI